MGSSVDPSSESIQNTSEKRWTERILRARELRNANPSAAETLHFYEVVLQCQKNAAEGASAQIRQDLPLSEQIDLQLAGENIASLLQAATRKGPRSLAAHAEQARKRTRVGWIEIFQSVLNNDAVQDTPDSFFARASLQPLAENLQLQLPQTQSSMNRCPCCNGLPQLSVLRPAGEGASRSLQCSMCLREWQYRRLVCLYCGEEAKENLPRYSDESDHHIHIEACETCKRYIKSVDMTMDGRAVPIVDEIALVAFDLWAKDHGYTKIIPNLMGF